MIIITITTLLFLIRNVTVKVAWKSKCEFFLQKIPGMSPMVLTDENGKKCRGVVEIPLCRGYCKTSESGTYTFPYRVQNSSACALIVTEIQVIPLTDCDDGASEKIRSVSLPTGQKCGCKRFPFD
uniref:Cys_knot domain-containing protein n=1 Tax=Angiostrongylus cantonensis TaxID=6313 RepID=A0A0K0DHG1_ANGCA